MELDDGYTMNLDDAFMLWKRQDGTFAKKEEKITKPLHLYRLSWKDKRWEGLTKQERVDQISKNAQKAINEEIEDFIKTDGSKYAKHDSDSSNDDDDDSDFE